MSDVYDKNNEPQLPFGDGLKQADGFALPEGYFPARRAMLEDKVTGSNDTQKGGFRVPENYFDTFANRLSQQLPLGLPAEVRADEGFRIPKGYFEQFRERLTAASIPGAVTPRRSTSVRVRRFWSYAVAATVFAATCWLVLDLYRSPAQADLLAGCSEDELLEYIEANAAEFDGASLALLLDDETSVLPELPETADENLDELLIEYLQ